MFSDMFDDPEKNDWYRRRGLMTFLLTLGTVFAVMTAASSFWRGLVASLIVAAWGHYQYSNGGEISRAIHHDVWGDRCGEVEFDRWMEKYGK